VLVLSMHDEALFAERVLRAGARIKTIETYRSNIRTKLNLKGATDLIRFAATWTERL
jgi:DNA-binding NarL/FixJ family response regulator